MDGLLDVGDRPAKIDFASGVMQVVDRRMGEVIGTEDLFSLARFVRFPLIGDRLISDLFRLNLR